MEDDLKLVPIFLLWTKGEEKEDQLDRNYFYELFFLIKWFSFKNHRWRGREPPWQKWCLGRVGWCAGLYQFLTSIKTFGWCAFPIFHFLHFSNFLPVRYSDDSHQMALFFVETALEGVVSLHTGGLKTLLRWSARSLSQT